MTIWLTDRKALEYVGIPVDADNLRLLKVLGHKKKIRWTKILGHIQYDQDSLDEYREQKARGKTCAVSRNSSNLPTEPEVSNPPTGTSNITREDLDAALLGVSLARKTMQRKSRLPISSLNESARNQRSQTSL